MAHKDHSQRTKQHALRRDVHRLYPLWVYDDDDWNLMHGDDKLPVGDLICPATGCRTELVAVERRMTGVRFLRNRPGTVDCGHAFGRAHGGGPPSAEHRWLQQRLAMLCSDLGYVAIQEHYESRADVWVASTPPLAIEIQRWMTKFTDRSESRKSKGANVLWLLPESASSKKAGRELFRQPAARIRVFKRGSRTEQATPWKPGHSGRVLLWVGATVMRPSPDGLTLISSGNFDAKMFLREVLEGERKWYGPNEAGFAGDYGWARPEDVERMRAMRHCGAIKSGATASATPVAESLPSTAIERPAVEPITHVPEEIYHSTPTLRSHGAGDHEHQECPDITTASALTDAPYELQSEGRSNLKAPTPRGWLRRLKIWLTKGTEDD